MSGDDARAFATRLHDHGEAYESAVAFDGQISFPASQNASSGANVLDDYQENTWTPTMTGTTSGEVTYNDRSGSYIKVGRLVAINGFIDCIRNTAVGVPLIGGLPFTPDTTKRSCLAIGTFNGYLAFTGYTPLLISDFASWGAYVLRAHKDGSSYDCGTTVNIPTTGACQLYFSGTYEAAD